MCTIKTVYKLYYCQLTRRLGLVGDDTTDEVRLGTPQGGHQVVQLLL